MRYIWLTVVLLSVAVVGPWAKAEMYKYRDTQGNVHYTDNLAQIPEDQRPRALTMETVSADDATIEKEENTTKAHAGDLVEPQGEDAVVFDDETIAALNTRKKALDDEFSGLMANKYALLEEKQRLDGLAGRDVEARQAYEGKVAELNQRIADYATRRDAFQKEVDRVKQALEPGSPGGEEDTPKEGPEASSE